MYGYIYITTNLITGKQYIGQHKSKQFDFTNYKGSGRVLRHAFKKYGRGNFECKLLEPIDGVKTICDSKAELNESEIFYIKYYDCVNNPNFYNLAKGGASDSYHCLTPEQQQIRNKKISIANTGRRHTPEVKAKLSAMRLGKYRGKDNPNYGNHKLKERYASGEYVSPCLGIKHTEEYKKDLSRRCKELGINKGAKSGHFGQHWFTDGTINIQAFVCPDGFHPGRTCAKLGPRKKKAKNE